METIDCTPTWEGITPYLIILLKDGDREGQKTAEVELKRMAQLADLYVKSQKPEPIVKLGEITGEAAE
jgi:hypothetical protein